MDDELSLSEIVRLERAVKALGDVMQPVNSGSQSTVTINAGGVGVLISSVCCAVMFTITVIGGFVGAVAYSELKRDFQEVREDQRATKAYLQGIWQQAPHLNPES